MNIEEIKLNCANATQDKTIVELAIKYIPELISSVENLKFAIREAMCNIGVPTPDYTAPITEAYRILDTALNGKRQDE